MRLIFVTCTDSNHVQWCKNLTACDLVCNRQLSVLLVVCLDQSNDELVASEENCLAIALYCVCDDFAFVNFDFGYFSFYQSEQFSILI